MYLYSQSIAYRLKDLTAVPMNDQMFASVLQHLTEFKNSGADEDEIMAAKDMAAILHALWEK